MEAENPRLHCIATGGSSQIEEVSVKMSCFGFGKKKARPLQYDPGHLGSAQSSPLKASPPSWREDDASGAVQSGQRQCADASPRSWEYQASRPGKCMKHFSGPFDEPEKAQQLTDDEGTQAESVSDGQAEIAMHDSTSSLKEGVYGKAKAEAFPRDAIHSESLDEEGEEEGASLSKLHKDYEINPHDIYFCSRANGKLCRIGKGAFGTVYKGVWKDQTVAVKVCKQQHITKKAMEQFQKEVSILHGCHNDYIVQFKGACCWKGGKRTVLVTEFMEKGDLCTALGRLPSKYSWNSLGKKIALDVARGLAFLHGDNIVHFDLKSANILLDKSDRAKLADVGLAKTLTNYHDSDHLSTFMATGDLGTFAWAAPEVLLGFSCDSKADIFSFGVVMWELATTEMPQGRCLRPIREEEAPMAVADLIMDCLRHDPTARPTALELVTTLSHMV